MKRVKPPPTQSVPMRAPAGPRPPDASVTVTASGSDRAELEEDALSKARRFYGHPHLPLRVMPYTAEEDREGSGWQARVTVVEDRREPLPAPVTAFH